MISFLLPKYKTFWASITMRSLDVRGVEGFSITGFSIFKDLSGKTSEVIIKKIKSKKTTSTRGVKSMSEKEVFKFVLKFIIFLIE